MSKRAREDGRSGTYTWRFKGVSSAPKEVYSAPFEIGGVAWCLWQRHGTETSTDLSVYLKWAETGTLPPLPAPVASYTIKVVNQHDNSKSWSGVVKDRAVNPNWGFGSTVPLLDVKDPAKGWVVKDTLLIQVDIEVTSDTRDLAGTPAHPTRLDLVCGTNPSEHMLVRSDRLIAAVCNEPFCEIINLAMKAAPNVETGIAQLALPDDSGAAWAKCWALITDPEHAALAWSDLSGVLQLGDKYELQKVLKMVEQRVSCTLMPTLAANNPQGAPLPDMALPATISGALSLPVAEMLDLLEKLHACRLFAAYQAVFLTWTRSLAGTAAAPVRVAIRKYTKGPCSSPSRLAVVGDLMDWVMSRPILTHL